jgi:hypothetical protein
MSEPIFIPHGDNNFTGMVRLVDHWRSRALDETDRAMTAEARSAALWDLLKRQARERIADRAFYLDALLTKFSVNDIED